MIVSDDDRFAHVYPIPRWILNKQLKGFARLFIAVFAGYLALGFQTTASVAAQKEVVLTGAFSSQRLAGKIDYFLDFPGTQSIKGVAGNSAIEFKPLKSNVADFGYTQARVWLRIQLRNETASTDNWRLYFPENFKQIFEVYILRTGGEIEPLLIQNLNKGFATRPIAFPELVAPLKFAPGEAATVYVRYWSEGSSELSFSIETTESFEEIAAKRTAKNFIYYGMTILLILVALLSMLIFRHVVFLAYVAYAVSTLVFIMHGDGVAFQYLWPDYPRFNSYASILAGAAIIIFGGNYARVFLQTRRFHPVLDKFLLASISLTAGIVAASFFIDNQPLKKLLILVALLSIALYFVTGLIAARHRFKQVRFYVLAWAGAVGSALVMTLRHWLGIEISQDFQNDSMRVVMVFDATMMGLAIADRYNQLRQSRQDALTSSLGQAERNLELNHRLHDLEEQYSLAVGLAKSRDQQIQNTIHDLRQPLHALRMNVKQVAGGKGSAGEGGGNIDTAFTYLEKLVSDQLKQPLDDHSDVQPSSSETIDDLGVQSVLKSIHEMFEVDARNKGLDFRFVPTSGESDVEPLVIMRCISNLVSNAIKYTPKGGVLLGCRKRGRILQIEVHDTGPGLSETEFELAQHRNTRLERTKSDQEGNGFGLAIARDLADRYGLALRLDTSRKSGTGIILEVPLQE